MLSFFCAIFEAMDGTKWGGYNSSRRALISGSRRAFNPDLLLLSRMFELNCAISIAVLVILIVISDATESPKTRSGKDLT